MVEERQPARLQHVEPLESAIAVQGDRQHGETGLAPVDVARGIAPAVLNVGMPHLIDAALHAVEERSELEAARVEESAVAHFDVFEVGVGRCAAELCQHADLGHELDGARTLVGSAPGAFDLRDLVFA